MAAKVEIFSRRRKKNKGKIPLAKIYPQLFMVMNCFFCQNTNYHEFATNYSRHLLMSNRKRITW